MPWWGLTLVRSHHSRHKGYSLASSASTPAEGSHGSSICKDLHHFARYLLLFEELERKKPQTVLQVSKQQLAEHAQVSLMTGIVNSVFW